MPFGFADAERLVEGDEVAHLGDGLVAVFAGGGEDVEDLWGGAVLAADDVLAEEAGDRFVVFVLGEALGGSG